MLPLCSNAAITQQYSIVAAYGMNGLTEEHQEAIRNLKELEEVISFLMETKAERWQ
jgi:hypothetical protein